MKKWLVISLLLIGCSKQKDYKWIPSFAIHDTNPYGCQLVYESLHEIFPDKKIDTHDNKITIDSLIRKETGLTADNFYSFEEYGTQKIKTTPQNYVFINSGLALDSKDISALNYVVSQGSHVFIAARVLGDDLANYLDIKTNQNYNSLSDTTFNIKFIDNNQNHTFSKSSFMVGTAYISEDLYTSTNFNNRAVLNKDAFQNTTMIRVEVGKGSFIISSTPLAFTNYNLLKKENTSFLEKAFSYLPVQNTTWFTKYSTYNERKKPKRETRSPWSYFMQQPPLKWAILTALVLILLFALFGIKRKQRLIPIINKPKNSTTEFLDVIGHIYYQKSDHKEIALKKIVYLLEAIRSRYGIKTQHLDQDFCEKLVTKSGISREIVYKLVETILSVKDKTTISTAQLIVLNKLIEDFNKKTL